MPAKVPLTGLCFEPRSQRPGNVVEFGCGYGLFTVEAAKRSSGTVYTLDIEPEMVSAPTKAFWEAGVAKVQPVERDFVIDGTGLPRQSCDYAMVFNLSSGRPRSDFVPVGAPHPIFEGGSSSATSRTESSRAANACGSEAFKYGKSPGSKSVTQRSRPATDGEGGGRIRGAISR